MRIYKPGSIEPVKAAIPKPQAFVTTDPVAAMMLTGDANSAAEMSGLPFAHVMETIQERQLIGG